LRGGSAAPGAAAQGDSQCLSSASKCGADGAKEQKAELAEALTDAIVRIGKTSADHTIVIFEDIDKDNWAEGGKLASEL